MRRPVVMASVLRRLGLLAGLIMVTTNPLAAEQPGAMRDPGQQQRDFGSTDPDCNSPVIGSPYIPVDSWIYSAVLRLYSLGYVDTVYLGMRPWTRASVVHILKDVTSRIQDAEEYPTVGEAQGIYDALIRELSLDMVDPCQERRRSARVESVYSIARAMSGTPLRDSFHLGQSIINDYGRPYASGFNNYTGVSGYASAGRFLVYARGEFQGARSSQGYSAALAQTLSSIDLISYLDPITGQPYNQATIPQGPLGAASKGRVIEAYASAQLLNHVFSFGKQDDWLGPGQGGAMAYSNNAENIYSFRINRIEPLQIPLLWRVTGPFRYEFLIGPLRGHTYIPNPAYEANPSPDIPNVINPGNPWVHIEKISFRPTANLEFGFERTAIWGGKGHGPITLHTFLKSFFSTASPDNSQKYGREDPGARFGAFDFSYRLPFLRHWLTLYTDSEAHDDVSPIDAPRHACVRPGLYLSHLPGVPKLDIRVEGVSTDPPTPLSQGGRFEYWEQIQRQGYTNQGQLFGDWIGREDKGGQGWITYHMTGNELVQLSLRNQKAEKDFVPGGTTLNEVNVQVVKRIGKNLEVNGNFAYEHWKAPIYLPNMQTVTATTIRITWFPERKISF